MLEKAVENQIKRELTKRNAWFFKTMAGGGVPKGIPDILALYGGKFIVFENKRPDGKGHITFVQKQQLDVITKHGGIGVIPMSLSFVIDVLDHIDDVDYLKTLGYLSHGRKELDDPKWLEETIW